MEYTLTSPSGTAAYLSIPWSDVAVLECDKANIIVRASKCFAQLVHQAPQSLVGHALEAILEPVIEAGVLGCLPLGERVLRCDSIIGEPKWLREQQLPVSVAHGRSVYLYTDVTAQYLHRKGLVEARNAAEIVAARKASFLANMSHEIRTPLNSILGFTGLLKDVIHGASEQRFLGIIEKSSQTLLGLLNNVLDFSKMEAQRIEVDTRPVRPLAVAQEAIALFAHQAAEKSLELRLEASLAVPDQIRSDYVRFSQILNNLISNAIKYTTEGHVAVNLHTEPHPEKGWDHVRITVSDTGCGISPAQQVNLFDPFYQADPQQLNRVQGTGLGLAITQRLVNLMGGRIWLDSEVGVGTTFYVVLPVEVLPAVTVRSPVWKSASLHRLAANDPL